MGTTYAEAYLFQEAIDMHWGGSYSNPYDLWGRNKYPMLIISSSLAYGNDSITASWI